MKRKKFIQNVATGIIAGAALPLSCSTEDKNKIIAASNLKTPLCDILNIKYPILQAGMADVAGPDLVAAVSNAGGLGILSGTMVPPNVLRERIAKIKDLTNQPFGVNLILHNDLFPPADFNMSDNEVKKVQGMLNVFRKELNIPESNAKPPKLPPLIQQAYEIILEEKIPVFSIGLGNPPKEMVEQCHSNGIKIMAMITTLEDALTVNENRVDIIVAQGSEAGGHRSTWEKKKSKEYGAIGTLPLTIAVAQAVKVPVISAGGIVNGKGLKSALAAGAQGVMIGTRFIATKESMAPLSYKKIIIESSSDDTTMTDVFTGMFARVIRNNFTEYYSETNTPVLPPGRQYAATIDIIKAAGLQEKAQLYTLYAGQGIDEIKSIKSSADVIKDIIAETFNG
ncbi:MAG: nitronate monooxygenase [Ignavibacteriaceae bacterium]